MAATRLALTFLCIAPLTAQRDLLAELPGESEAPSRFDEAEFGPELQPVDLPGKGLPRGLAYLGDRLWIARGDALICLQWPDRTELERVPSPADLVGLATDGKQLFGASKDRVFVLDKVAGRPMREVVLDVGPNVVALAYFRGALHVAADRRLLRVSLDTGATDVVGEVPVELQWLAADGEALFCGASSGVEVLVRGESVATWSGTHWPHVLAESTATWVDGRLLLLGASKPRAGGRRIVGLLDPVRCLPREHVTLRIQRGEAAGELLIRVGAGPQRPADALEGELARVVKIPAATIRYPDGSRALLPVVLEPWPGVTIAELSAMWDRVVAAGFKTVAAPQQETRGRRARQDRLAKEKAKQPRQDK